MVVTPEERQLYQEIAKQIAPEAPQDLMTIALEMLMTPDQARVFLAFPKAVAPVEEIAQETGFTTEFVEDTCRELYEKGYMVKTRRGWAPCRNFIQAFDTGPLQKWAEILGEDFFRLMRRVERENFYSPLRQPGEYPGLRIIPHIQALEMSGIPPESILPAENINAMFKEASAIAVNYCGCRRHEWGIKEREEGYVCWCLDRGAEYEVERGTGRMFTYDEAVDWMEKVVIPNWMGLTPMNQAVGAKMDYLCSCSYDVECVWEVEGFGEKSTLENSSTAPSRYQAVIDPTKCLSCQECVEKCKARAILVKQYPGERKYKAWVNPDLCMGCGCCVVNCRGGARKMICVRPPEFIPTTDRIQDFRYRTPEERAVILHPAALREKRIQRQREMEKVWCEENGIDRDPYKLGTS